LLQITGEIKMSQATITTAIVQPISIHESKECFKLSVQVIGIQRRCRKSERHLFHLGHVPYNDGHYDIEAIKNKVRDMLELNMKQICSVVRIHLDHVIIKNEGDFTSTLWEPFSDKNVRFDVNFNL
jgi:hypothetical protein